MESFGTKKPNNSGLSTQVEGIRSDVEKLNGLMIGIVVVLFIAFLGMLFSYFALLSDNWRHKEDAYRQNLLEVRKNSCWNY